MCGACGLISGVWWWWQSLARKVGPPRRDRAQLEGDMARLQEKREVLRVSREVWKKRIADMLTSMDEVRPDMAD